MLAGVSSLYHDGSRELQDRFDTRRLADRLDERIVRDVIRPEDRGFIERMDMFFHRMARVESSPYVPRAGSTPPVPDWKRSSLAAGALPAGDPAAETPGT
jgi:hypothetical protein